MSGSVLLASSLVMLLGGCFGARKPVAMASFTGDGSEALVLLPGVAANTKTLVREGIVEEVRAAGFTGDVYAADLHFGYYLGHAVPDRLEADVLGPLRGRYDRVWMIGISLGGMGALMAASQSPADLDGVIVLAPWHGRPGLAGRIARAGGIEAWQPPEEPHWDEAVWAWWKSHDAREGRPWVVTGFGWDDHVNGVPQVLVDRLPADRVHAVSGGHTWDNWRLLVRATVADHVVGHP